MSAWGPEERRAAVAITFDNLGEASALERGEWPPGRPLGQDLSVRRGLPRVLGLLADHELRATFFVEGINAQLYPEALHEIDTAGHEVGLHGWRHEDWADLDGTAERDLLGRSVDALAEIGLRPVGFRPPGGRLAPSSAETLKEAGFAYCSPAGDGSGVHRQLAVLPFRWTLIDAFHYLPSFAARRRAALGSPDPLPAPALRATLADAIREATDRGVFLALLFHPFLADTDDRLEVLRDVLADIHALAGEKEIWCAPLREIAAWTLAQPGACAWEVTLDED